MAEFLPKLKPGQSWSSTASADIIGGQLLAVTGDDLVGPAGASSVAVVGVAAFDCLSGGRVTVYSPKVAVLTSSGAITFGTQVVPAANGAVSALAVVTTPTAADVTGTRAVVGVAMTTAASNKVKVYFTR